MTTHRPSELDLRRLPPGEHPGRLFAAFDALGGGDGMVLVTDHDPNALLYQLQLQRPGDFNWSPLTDGPDSWCVRVDRRSPSHKRHRGVMEYLSWDHDRLDELIERVRADAQAHNWREAAHAFGEFRLGLLRHIRMEEELLFPAFEGRAGMARDAGPTAVMREEHGEIKSVLADIKTIVESAALSAAPPASARTSLEHAVRALLDVLVEHNLKEEQVLYPGADHLMEEDERDALVRRMMAVKP